MDDDYLYNGRHNQLGLDHPLFTPSYCSGRSGIAQIQTTLKGLVIRSNRVIFRPIPTTNICLFPLVTYEVLRGILQVRYIRPGYPFLHAGDRYTHYAMQMICHIRMSELFLIP